MKIETKSLTMILLKQTMIAIILVRQRFFVVNFKLNFEDQRDYSRAGDFHYDKMGMQRKRKMLEWE
jgi:hypothetical protein